MANRVKCPKCGKIIVKYTNKANYFLHCNSRHSIKENLVLEGDKDKGDNLETPEEIEETKSNTDPLDEAESPEVTNSSERDKNKAVEKKELVSSHPSESLEIQEEEEIMETKEEAQPEEPKVETFECPICGNPVEEMANPCPNCGASIEWGE